MLEGRETARVFSVSRNTFLIRVLSCYVDHFQSSPVGDWAVKEQLFRKLLEGVERPNPDMFTEGPILDIELSLSAEDYALYLSLVSRNLEGS